MIATAGFWEKVVLEANGSARFRTTAEHLKGLIVGFGIGDVKLFLDFHRGHVALAPTRPLEGAEVTIAGPIDEWQRLVSGKIPYVQAINVTQGKLRLDGNLVAAAWAVQALCELFRAAARVVTQEGQHA